PVLTMYNYSMSFFFSSRRRHTRSKRDWSSDVCSSDLAGLNPAMLLVVLAVLGGIGALVYFKFIKQKPKTKGSDNLDDYDYGEDDTEQEDEDPWETEESDEPEDAGGGGDEESENPAK